MTFTVQDFATRHEFVTRMNQLSGIVLDIQPATTGSGIDLYNQPSNDTIRHVVATQMGIPSAPDSHKCPLCNSVAHRNMRHSLLCKQMQRFRTTRHTEVQNAIKDALHVIDRNFVVKKEYFYADIHGIKHHTYLLPEHIQNKRCDLYIEHRCDPNFKLVIDIGVTTAFKRNISYKIAGEAAQKVQLDKDREFSEQFHVSKTRNAPKVLFPIFEAEGYGSQHSYLFLHTIAEKVDSLSFCSYHMAAKILKQAIAAAIAKTDHALCNLYAKKVGLPTDFEYRNDDQTRSQLIPEHLRVNSEERGQFITVPIEYLHLAPQQDVFSKKKKATAANNAQTPTPVEAVPVRNSVDNIRGEALEPDDAQDAQQQQTSPHSPHGPLLDHLQQSLTQTRHSQTSLHPPTRFQFESSPTMRRTRGKSRSTSASHTPPAERISYDNSG